MTANVFFGEDAPFDIGQKSVSTDFLTKPKEFDDIKAGSLLEDKRSTRTKSTGRPPSQLFMKERIFETSFSMNDDEIADEPTVNSASFSQVVQDVTSMHVSRTVVERSASSIVKGNYEFSKIQNVPWMSELLARKEKVSVMKGDEPVKIAEQNEKLLKFRRNEPETTKKPDELKAVEPPKAKEESVNDIQKKHRKMMAPPLPLDLPPKNPPEMVPKLSIKTTVLKDVENFLERGRQFEENTLMKIRELENSVRKQMEENVKAVEMLKRDLSKLIENS